MTDVNHGDETASERKSVAVRRYWWSHLCNGASNRQILEKYLRTLCEVDGVTEAIQHAMSQYPYFVKKQYNGIVKLFKSKGKVEFTDKLVKDCFRRAFVALGDHEVASVTGDFIAHLGLRLTEAGRLEEFTTFLLSCLLTGRRHQVYRAWLPRIFVKAELKDVFETISEALLRNLLEHQESSTETYMFNWVYNDYVLQSWVHVISHLLKLRHRLLAEKELQVLEIASQSAHVDIRLEAWKCIRQAERKRPKKLTYVRLREELTLAAVALNEHYVLDVFCADPKDNDLTPPGSLCKVLHRNWTGPNPEFYSKEENPSCLSAYWRVCDQCDFDEVFTVDQIARLVNALFDEDGNMRRVALRILQRRFRLDQVATHIASRINWNEPPTSEVIRLYNWSTEQGTPFDIPPEVPLPLKVLLVGVNHVAVGESFEACHAQIQETLKEGGSTGTGDVLTPGQLAAYLANDEEVIEITDDLKAKIQQYAARLIQPSQALVALSRQDKELTAKSCAIVEEVLLRSQHKGVLEACTRSFRELCELAKKEGDGPQPQLNMVDGLILSSSCQSRDLCFARIYSTVCLVWTEEANAITTSLIVRYASAANLGDSADDVVVKRRFLCILNHVLLTVKLNDDTLAAVYKFVLDELPINQTRKLHAKVWSGLTALIASTIGAIFASFPDKVSYAEFLCVRSTKVLNSLFDGISRFSKLPWAYNELGLFVFEPFERLILLDELMVDEAELGEPEDDPESKRLDTFIKVYITKCAELRNVVRDLLDSSIVTEPRVRRQLAHILVNLSSPSDAKQLLADASLPDDVRAEAKKRIDEAELGTARTEVTEYESNLVRLPAKLDDEPTEKSVASLSLTDPPETLAPIQSFSRQLNKFGVTLNAHHGLEMINYWRDCFKAVNVLQIQGLGQNDDPLHSLLAGLQLMRHEQAT
ncbi:hypothetical protein AAVH_15661 [Aphelenchoides avenae]|nr:hypothetical protein AAVH_15661 [Aphelenchus avenae]